MTNIPMFCTIYKGTKRPDHYLYLEKEGDFTRLPDSLLNMLGALEKVMDLELNAERRLARADAAEVITSLREQGYYLQLPPTQPNHHNPFQRN